MNFKEFWNKIKKLNDPEKLKPTSNLGKIYKEIKEMGLKKFWKTNDKVFKYGAILLVVLIVYGEFKNSTVYKFITENPKGAYGYFFFSFLAFILTVGYVINWYVTTGFRDSNTADVITRKKIKYKGVDWHKFDKQLKNPDQ